VTSSTSFVDPDRFVEPGLARVAEAGQDIGGELDGKPLKVALAGVRPFLEVSVGVAIVGRGWPSYIAIFTMKNCGRRFFWKSRSWRPGTDLASRAGARGADLARCGKY
jgi:hypothetical protein